MIELFQFQKEAAGLISDRFAEYYAEPLTVGRRNNKRLVPFYQALSSLTGSGKTAILAQAVNEISAMTEIAPIILWLSKGKVVVQQSFANLAAGGKYNHLLGDTEVRALGEYHPEDVEQAGHPLLYFATVGTFNQKEKEKSHLKIFAKDTDITESSRWEALKQRTDAEGRKRPLIVVYDEAQNLTDQQTRLLLEQQPAAFLLASATLSFPAQFNTDVTQQLKDQGEYSDDDLITPIRSSTVVDSGLIKSEVWLSGHKAPMEETVDGMLSDMREAEDSARALDLDFRPKAIYVCNTNQLADDAGEIDSPKQPFEQRQAPPIVIWRYLTEVCNVPAEEIAVYADLKTHKSHPLPDEFNLFAGGENDYDDFIAGDYRHIIFNKTLQEGWDDPTVYFAYIDQSMESNVRITQIIGRVLRQPEVRHYPDIRLNTAHFYVRVDHSEAFSKVIKDVQDQLASDAPEVRIITSTPGKKPPVALPPKKQLTVPKAITNSQGAKDPVAAVLEDVMDYTEDTSNTAAAGSRRTVRQTVGSAASEATEWDEFFSTAKVNARWIFRRQVGRQYNHALGAINTEHPKFDAKIGLGSRAEKALKAKANEAVQTYINNVIVKTTKPNPYRVGEVLVRRDDMVTFENAVHEGYDRLNSFEVDFAYALDEVGVTWARNPAQSGYKVPLVSVGTTDNFYPDFLMWVDGAVICFDTKGAHLIEEDARRKLLDLQNGKTVDTQVLIKLVTEGRWSSDGSRESTDGYSLWQLGSGRTMQVRPYEDLKKLLEAETQVA